MQSMSSLMSYQGLHGNQLLDKCRMHAAQLVERVRKGMAAPAEVRQRERGESE